MAVIQVLMSKSTNILSFYGKSYDDLNRFKDEATAELKKLKSQLNTIDEQVETIATSIEETRQYSYKYNVKIIGVPPVNLLSKLLSCVLSYLTNWESK